MFYFLSFVAIFSALLVVFSKESGAQCAIPHHYILFHCRALCILNAQFLAAVHVIVYAGAIMVLFLYVIMLLNLNNESEPHKSNLLKLAAPFVLDL